MGLYRSDLGAPESYLAFCDSGSANGKLLTQTYPSKARLNYSYDAAGRLQAITLNPVRTNGNGTNPGLTIVLLQGITYTALNQVKGWTWGAGVPYARTFDTHSRLATYPLGHPQGSGRAAGMTRTVAYDDAGRIAAYTHTGPTGAALPAFDQTFAYDGLDRLRQQQQLTTAYAWDHDLGGNRTSQTLGGTPYTHTVDTASNRLTTQSTPAGTTTLGYDAAGNLTTGATLRATYSDRGRLASLTLGTDTVAYRYNALEQRLLKSGPTPRVPGGVRYYVHDEQGHLIGEYDQATNPVFEVVYLNDTPVAVITQTRSGSGTTLNVQTQIADVYSDHLDTPRVITRHTDQAVLWRWDQAAAFGNSPPNDNPTGLGVFSFPLRFPGQVFDVESGLVYNHHRQYDPAVGRFLQSDPIGLDGGINTYVYAEGNPLSYVDPQGLHNGDKWYGFNNREFQRWFHKCWKQAGNADADKAEIAEAYADWVSRGSPTGGKCDNTPPPPPAPEPDACGDTCKKTATVVVVGGTSYVIYRCLRMLPSLLPPLWPTIPANVVVP